MSGPRKYTEAQKESAKKWDAANLDRVSIAMAKGKKDKIKVAASAAGESMNQYIVTAIDQRMEWNTETENSSRSNHGGETSRTSTDLYISRLKGETLSKGKGQPKEQRDFNKIIADVVSTMYDTDRVVEHTVDDLIEDMTAIIDDFTKKIKRSLQNHSTVLQDQSARERAIAALSEAETVIDGMKETMERDNAAPAASEGQREGE